MSLWDYMIFDKIVETGSMREAAESLHLTPAAVSHSLGKLEKRFGLSLLVRSRVGIELTHYGRELLPHMRAALDADSKLLTEVSRIKGELHGSVRIGVFNSVCCAWMPAILQRMRQVHPDVVVKLVQDGYGALENGLLVGALDLAFVSIPTKNRISPMPLLRDRLLCITTPDFVPHNGSYITIEEIRDFELIIPGAGSDFDARVFMEANGLSVKTEHNIIEDSSIIALVESGMGVSIMPELVLQKTGGDIHVYPIESAPYRSIGIATQAGAYISPQAEALLKLIVEYVHERYPTEEPYFRT